MRLLIFNILAASFLFCCLIACPQVPENDPPITETGLFYVYHDAEYSLNHYAPSGWMGDIDAMEFDDTWTENTIDGGTCQRWTYNADQGEAGWAGVVWQDPENNWDGDFQDGGYDLSDMIALVFQAKGDKGGEIVTFGFGGLEGQFPDSVSEQKKTVTLGTDWKTYQIVVEHLDLSSVHNGFMWTIDSSNYNLQDITFYLDEIYYAFYDQLINLGYKIPGVCLGPFTEGQDPNNGDLVTIEQVESHIAFLSSRTKWIRTYGMEGGLLEAGRIAHDYGLKIAMGAWISDNDESNQRELDALIEKALAGEVDVAVIGNEVLHRRDLEVGELISLIEKFRLQVPHVPVTTSEVYSLWITYPELVAACDQLFIHCYPFWDGVTIDNAVCALKTQYKQVLDAAEGKTVIISETGWPSDGQQVGNSVPSGKNAASYFLSAISWAQSSNVQLFYFEAFDEPFKAATEPYGVGDHWGVFDRNLKLKDQMELVFWGCTTFDNCPPDIPCGEGEPTIEFTSVPPYGSYEDLRGQVCHAFPEDYAVAVYIYVSGWWTKPYFDRPLTLIQADGTFVVDITTGGWDHNATAIAAYLVSMDYDPPLARGGSLPSSIQTDAFAECRINR